MGSFKSCIVLVSIILNFKIYDFLKKMETFMGIPHIYFCRNPTALNIIFIKLLKMYEEPVLKKSWVSVSKG